LRQNFPDEKMVCWHIFCKIGAISTEIAPESLTLLSRVILPILFCYFMDTPCVSKHKAEQPKDNEDEETKNTNRQTDIHLAYLSQSGDYIACCVDCVSPRPRCPYFCVIVYQDSSVLCYAMLRRTELHYMYFSRHWQELLYPVPLYAAGGLLVLIGRAAREPRYNADSVTLSDKV